MTDRPRLRVAMISVHACPLAPIGAWETGGMNVYIREISRHLSDFDVAVDVFTRAQGPDCSTVEPLGRLARVVHVPAGPPRYLAKELVVGYLPEFICNMREFVGDEGTDYDIVHAHYWLSGRVAGYFKNAWQVPMVAMFHTLAELKNQVTTSADEWEGSSRVAIEQLTVATADRVIASTPIDSGHLETFYGADGSRIRVVPCGVDLDRFTPGPAGVGLQRAAAERTILFVGRIQQLKGIDLLLQAVALLAERQRRGAVPPFRVVVVGGRSSTAGDDPEARELRRLHALAHALGIEPYLTWAGAVEHDELPDYYRAADVTVMPSTYESFGLVAVESMACGTPVVAARVGGLKATVVDHQTGYLIAERDPASYAERIAAILTRPELQHRLGMAARERATRFGWRAVASQLVDLYTSMTHTQGRPARAAALAR